MVKIDKLCEDFRTALAMECPYVSPGNTTMSTIKSGVDCSGIFCAAFGNQGGNIYHGSNTIYRSYLTDKGPLTKVSQLFVGAAVFKWSESGEPSKYEKDGLGNFQHIGLVVSVNPLQIIHASSAAGCVTMDTKLGKWKYWGRLKGVDYSAAAAPVVPEKPEIFISISEGIDNMYYGIGEVKTNGGTLNVRDSASSSARKIGALEYKSAVSLVAKEGNWWKIEYDGNFGYVSADYITVVRDIPTESAPAQSGSAPSDSGVSFDWCAFQDRLQEIKNELVALTVEFQNAIDSIG